MTDEEKLNLVGMMTDETSESVLSAYLSLAKMVILEKAFPFGNYPEDLPDQYDAVHVEIAAYMINKRGAEGEIVHLENGVSRHWEDAGVAPSLLRRITPYAVPIKANTNETVETEP